MTTGASVKLLVKEIVLILIFCHIVLTSSNILGLDEICVRKNGTICYHRALEECRFGSQAAHRLKPAINHEAVVKVTAYVSKKDPSSRPQRYFKLEWTQAFRSLVGPVFVHISQLGQWNVLQDQATCMSNYGGSEMETSELDTENKQSTLVFLAEDVTSALLEISMPGAHSEILVELPKYSLSSYIFQAVSITVLDKTAYISLSPASKERIDSNYYLDYSLTLVCYTYVNGGNFPHNGSASSLNILPSSVESTDCSRSNEEIQLKYNASSPLPIVYKMTHPAYELFIDVILKSIVSDSVSREINLNTLKFGYSGMKDVNTTASERTTTRDSITQKSLMDSGKQITYSSLREQNNKTDISKVIWGISVTIAALILLAVGLLIIKKRRQTKNSNKTQENAMSEAHYIIEASKNSTGQMPYIVQDTQPYIKSGRKPKLRSECCPTNRNSDLSSIDNASDLLISTTHISNESLHHLYNSKNHKSRGNVTSTNVNYGLQHDLKIELILDNVLASKGRFQDCNYQILFNGKKPKELNEHVVNPVVPQSSYDCIATYTDSNSSIQSRRFDNLTSVRTLPRLFDRNLSYFANSFKRWSSSVHSLTEQIMQRENVVTSKEIDFENFSVNEPELLDDIMLKAETMASECIKINQMYEDLTENISGAARFQSNEIEDECFSICESIAC